MYVPYCTPPKQATASTACQRGTSPKEEFHPATGYCSPDLEQHPMYGMRRPDTNLINGPKIQHSEQNQIVPHSERCTLLNHMLMTTNHCCGSGSSQTGKF
jgi:hypothetical protein